MSKIDNAFKNTQQLIDDIRSMISEFSIFSDEIEPKLNHLEERINKIEQILKEFSNVSENEENWNFEW